MAYDKDKHGILISVTKLSDGDSTSYWYDLRTNGFFKEDYDDSVAPYCLFYYDSNTVTYKGLLLGSKDGYIRYPDEATKDDETTSSTAAIDGYFVLPVIEAADDNNKVKLTSLAVTMSGGAAAGAESDSDGVTLSIYSAEDSETVIEDIEDGATAVHTITITGPGKADRIRNRTSGHSLALRFRNNTANESFGIERVAGKVEEIKRY